MTATTSILVRVQAKGGKFLADDIGGAEVMIRDSLTGERLGGGLVQGTDSGNLASSYTAGASPSVIVTPGDPPAVQWLIPDETTSHLKVDLPIRRPTLLEISAWGPLGGLQSAHRVTATQWIVPGQKLDQPPGFILLIPGLIVQVLSPPTHLTLTSLPQTVSFEANVAMMCGCPIADGEPWLPADFDITASIGPAGQPAGTVVPLAYTGTTSLFSGTWQVAQSGFYQAAVTAIQKSTGNTGTGTVTFFVKT